MSFAQGEADHWPLASLNRWQGDALMMMLVLFCGDWPHLARLAAMALLLGTGLGAGHSHAVVLRAAGFPAPWSADEPRAVAGRVMKPIRPFEEMLATMPEAVDASADD